MGKTHPISGGGTRVKRRKADWAAPEVHWHRWLLPDDLSTCWGGKIMCLGRKTEVRHENRDLALNDGHAAICKQDTVHDRMHDHPLSWCGRRKCSWREYGPSMVRRKTCGHQSAGWLGHQSTRRQGHQTGRHLDHRSARCGDRITQPGHGLDGQVREWLDGQDLRWRWWW